MAYQKVYMNQIHSSSLLCQLSQMWKRDILCDAVIQTGAVQTKAHRIVLVAACPMIQSMDGAALGNKLEVKLSPDIQQEAVTTFLQYLYDGFMMLTEDNVQDVEKIARMLQVDSVAKCCSDFYKVLKNEIGQTFGRETKFSFHADEAEFRHVRASELLRSMQNGSEKRSVDSDESTGRKKVKGQRKVMSSRTPTDDSFELSQIDNDLSHGVSKLISQQTMSVASKTNSATHDVQVLNIGGDQSVSDLRGSQIGKHGIQGGPATKSHSLELYGNRTSPCLQRQRASPHAFTPTLRHPIGAKHKMFDLMNQKYLSIDALSKSVSKPLHAPHLINSTSGYQENEHQSDPEQITIQLMETEGQRSSVFMPKEADEPSVSPPSTKESENKERTDGFLLSKSDYGDMTLADPMTPDMTLVKVEKTAYDEGYNQSSTTSDEYGVGGVDEDEMSDTEIYQYSDTNYGTTSGDEPPASWYTQTFKDMPGSLSSLHRPKISKQQDGFNLTDTNLPHSGHGIPASGHVTSHSPGGHVTLESPGQPYSHKHKSYSTINFNRHQTYSLKHKIIRALAHMKSPIAFLRPLQRKISGVKSEDLREACMSLTLEGFGKFELKHHSSVLQRDAYFKPAPSVLASDDPLLTACKISYTTYMDNFNDVSELSSDDINCICLGHPQKEYVKQICNENFSIKNEAQENLGMPMMSEQRTQHSDKNSPIPLFNQDRPTVPTAEEFRSLWPKTYFQNSPEPGNVKSFAHISEDEANDTKEGFT